MKKKPILVVLTGFSGLNKTHLALELAKKLQGRAITASTHKMLMQTLHLSGLNSLWHQLGLARSVDGFQPFPSQRYPQLAGKEILNSWDEQQMIPIVVGDSVYCINSLLQYNNNVSKPHKLCAEIERMRRRSVLEGGKGGRQSIFRGRERIRYVYDGMREAFVDSGRSADSAGTWQKG